MSNLPVILASIDEWQSFSQTLTIWEQQHTGCALSFPNRTFSSKPMMLYMQEDTIRFNREQKIIRTIKARDGVAGREMDCFLFFPSSLILRI